MRKTKIDLLDAADEALAEDGTADAAPVPEPEAAQPEIVPETEVIPEPPVEPLGLKPRLDLAEVRATITAGRTPTCPDCGWALTQVPNRGARLPVGWEAPDPEAHRCRPEVVAALQRARSFQTRPGESILEARTRRLAGPTERLNPSALLDGELF